MHKWYKQYKKNLTNKVEVRLKMCGIFCELSYTSSTKHMDENTLHRIQNRGPDCAHSTHVMVKENVQIYFYGAVLWMQGPAPFRQPVENDLGILLFNGDIFDELWDNNLCDTQALMESLSKSNSSEQQIILTLCSLKGPFSIIYYDKIKKNLFFSRDRIGRTSLLCCNDGLSFVLANVLGRNHKCVEVPATHLYKLSIEDKKLSIYSWNNSEAVVEHDVQNWINIVQKQQNVPDDKFTFEYDTSYLDTNDDEDVIQHIQTTSLQHTCKLTIMKLLLENDIIFKTVHKITELLEKSIKIRLMKHPQKCKNCIDNNTIICNHSTVGVLFSGGLDCTILAFLADKYVPKNQPIDLINVAFKMTDNTSYDVPDRVTGRQSFNELRKKCKSRQWVFREINIPKEKLQQYQINTIGDLVYPRHTILDESLGSALWFAASGEDDVGVSPCRVLLLGSGADELFGGYVRHRNAFKRYGWKGLSMELMLDWKRISLRNLARDNRVICDHGRQPRMPYLDEELTEYVLALSPWMKCFPSEQLPCGLGDKLILRLVAFHLGLTEVTNLPKRALQFGSKIANKKEKGTDISKHLVFNNEEIIL